jgi:hypothetical protein
MGVIGPILIVVVFFGILGLAKWYAEASDRREAAELDQRCHELQENCRRLGLAYDAHVADLMANPQEWWAEPVADMPEAWLVPNGVDVVRGWELVPPATMSETRWYRVQKREDDK